MGSSKSLPNILKNAGSLSASASATGIVTYGISKLVGDESQKTRGKGDGKNDENKNKFNLANEGLSDLEDNENKSTDSAKSA